MDLLSPDIWDLSDDDETIKEEATLSLAPEREREPEPETRPPKQKQTKIITSKPKEQQKETPKETKKEKIDDKNKKKTTINLEEEQPVRTMFCLTTISAQ